MFVDTKREGGTESERNCSQERNLQLKNRVVKPLSRGKNRGGGSTSTIPSTNQRRGKLIVRQSSAAGRYFFQIRFGWHRAHDKERGAPIRLRARQRQRKDREPVTPIAKRGGDAHDPACRSVKRRGKCLKALLLPWSRPAVTSLS